MNFYVIILFICTITHQTQLHAATEPNESSQSTTLTSKPFRYYDLPVTLRRSIADFVGLNIPNKYGWLPLQIATACCQFKKVRGLLNQSVSPNILSDRHPTPPLSFAASCNYALCPTTQEKQQYTSIAKLLLAHGAKPDLIDERGQTPIHQAILNNNIAVLNELIKVTPNLNVLNRFGQTPYELAQSLATRSASRNEDRCAALAICMILRQAQRQKTARNISCEK